MLIKAGIRQLNDRLTQKFSTGKSKIKPENVPFCQGLTGEQKC